MFKKFIHHVILFVVQVVLVFLLIQDGFSSINTDAIQFYPFLTLLLLGFSLFVFISFTFNRIGYQLFYFLILQTLLPAGLYLTGSTTSEHGYLPLLLGLCWYLFVYLVSIYLSQTTLKLRWRSKLNTSQ